MSRQCSPDKDRKQIHEVLKTLLKVTYVICGWEVSLEKYQKETKELVTIPQ